jgi:hypothetical protein
MPKGMPHAKRTVLLGLASYRSKNAEREKHEYRKFRGL